MLYIQSSFTQLGKGLKLYSLQYFTAQLYIIHGSVKRLNGVLGFPVSTVIKPPLLWSHNTLYNIQNTHIAIQYNIHNVRIVQALYYPTQFNWGCAYTSSMHIAQASYSVQ